MNKFMKFYYVILPMVFCSWILNSKVGILEKISPKITNKQILNLILNYSWPFWWYIDDIYHESIMGNSVVAPRVSHTLKACG